MRRQRAFQFNARLCGVFSLATLLAAACTLPDAPGTSAQSVVPPPLGTAAAFAILAGSTVTNTGNAVVNGDVGVWPGSAVIGFPPGIITGTLHVTDGPAMAAQSDTTVAYDGLAGLPCGTALTGTNLGGLTLATGVYCFTSSAQLTGTLTLQGDANAVFVFQIATGITTAPSSAVVMIGGAVANNVYWQVGTSATLDTGTLFKGNILALASISGATGSSLQGRALARNGGVTIAGGSFDSITGGQPPPADAGLPDAGPRDAGPPDAGPPDAGPPPDAGGLQANLSVTNSDSPDPVMVGATLTNRLVVRNLGPAAANGVILTYGIPSATTFISVTRTQGTCSVVGPTLTCLLGSLLNGASATVDVVVRPNTAGLIVTTAGVVANEADPDLANNLAIADTTVLPLPAAVADVSITLTDLPDPVIVGTRLTYTAVVRNLGSSLATGIVATYGVPASLSMVTATSTQGTCSIVGPTLRCLLGSLLNNATATVTIAGTPTLVGSIVSSIGVTALEPDPNLANNLATAETTVIPVPPGTPSADLSLVKTGSPSVVAAGAPLTYTMVVTNNGPNTATAVRLSDTLPAGVTLVSATAGCSGTTPVVCNLGDIANGGRAAVTIVVLPSGAVATLTNTASVSSPVADPDTRNNTASATTSVIVADMAVTLRASPEVIGVSSPLTYTSVVTNNGPSPATGVIFTDTLPATVRLVSATPATCAGTTNASTATTAVVCRLGDIAVGASASVVVVVTVLDKGPVVNTVRVSAGVFDPNLNNNSASVTVQAIGFQSTGSAGCYGSVGGAGASGLAGFAALALLGLLLWRKRSRSAMVLLPLAFFALMPTPAPAQPNNTVRAVDTQLFRPATGRFDLFTIETSRIPEPGQFTFGISYNYQRDPLVLRVDRAVIERVVSDQQTANLYFSVAVTKFLQMALDLPINVRMDGRGGRALRVASSALETKSFGDLRLDLKWRLIGEGVSGFGLAIGTPVTFPTGGEEGFRGEWFTFAPRVLVDYFWGRVAVAAEVGYLMRRRVDLRDLRFDNQMFYGAGARVALWRDDAARERVSLIAEVNGRTRAMDAMNENPMELLAGLRFSFPNQGLAVNVGGGAGLQAGFGAPSVRAFAGLSWSPEAAPVARVAEVSPAAPPPPPCATCAACTTCAPPPEPTPAPAAIPCPPAPTPPPVVIKHQPVVMRLNHFYFRFNKFNPDAGKRQSLDRLIQVLKTYPTLTLQVEGHTDPVGAAAYNVRLSRRRATAVRNYLVEQGIDGTRVVAVGFGEAKPIGDNTTKDGRRENRRVEIRFTSPIPEDLRIQLLRLEF